MQTELQLNKAADTRAGQNGEAAAIAQLLTLNLDSVKPVPPAARRGQHPKHHGCVAARMRVRRDVPQALRVGIFAAPSTFAALIRFSNGRTADDRDADAHGMAIKLLDVPGRKILGDAADERAQDFVLVDHETFFTGDPAEYALVARATFGRGLITRVVGWLCLLLRPRLLARIRAFISKQPASPLEGLYFSTVPFRLGAATVKYVVASRTAPPQTPVEGPDGLADALARTLAAGPVWFDFGVDVQTDPKRQPIEDPTIAWSVAGAQRVWLAELEIPAQTVERKGAIAENLAFSVWHTLPAHEPLGFINRARRPIYREMARARHRLNGVVPISSSEAPASYGVRPPLSAQDVA